MKNIKILGIIVIIAIIGFTMTACPGDDDESKDAVWLGETLNLSGQVYSMDMNYTLTPNNITLASVEGFILEEVPVGVGEYTNIVEVYIGGNGSVEAGQLSYTIDTPDSIYVKNLSDSIYGKNLSETSNVNGLVILRLSDKNNHLYLHKVERTATGYILTDVLYVYVDNDFTYTQPERVDDYGRDTIIYNSFSIRLRKGWNAVYKTMSYNSSNETGTISIANPSNLYWVYQDHNYDDNYSIIPSEEAISISLFNLPRSIFGKRN